MSLGRNNVNEKNGFILATSSIATLQQPAYAYTFYSFLVLVAAIQLRHFEKYVKGNENIPYNAKLALRSLHTQRLPLCERQRLRQTKGLFTPSDSVTVTVTFDGQNGYACHSARQRSKVPVVNVTVTVTQSLGVNES